MTDCEVETRILLFVLSGNELIWTGLFESGQKLYWDNVLPQPAFHSRSESGLYVTPACYRLMFVFFSQEHGCAF